MKKNIREKDKEEQKFLFVAEFELEQLEKKTIAFLHIQNK